MRANSRFHFVNSSGSCCFVTILLAPASKDEIPIGVSAAVDKRRFCGNGPRQQAAGTRRVPKFQIHLSRFTPIPSGDESGV